MNLNLGGGFQAIAQVSSCGGRVKTVPGQRIMAIQSRQQWILFNKTVNRQCHKRNISCSLQQNIVNVGNTVYAGLQQNIVNVGYTVYAGFWRLRRLKICMTQSRNIVHCEVRLGNVLAAQSRTLWCLAPYGVSLQEALPTLQSQTLWCFAYFRVRLHGVLHTAESDTMVWPTAELDSMVSCPLQSQTQLCLTHCVVRLNAHCRVRLHCEQHKKKLQN